MEPLDGNEQYGTLAVNASLRGRYDNLVQFLYQLDRSKVFFIIGSLGVLDDVTATQASTVFELRRANDHLGPSELFSRALNVGRDHIASTVNTLVLAYVSASLPLVVLLTAQPEPLGLLISRDLFATEIVRTLMGSTGIVAAVPITTAIAAFIVSVVGAEGETDAQ